MPYSIRKGHSGCRSGYAVVKTESGKMVPGGCHKTRGEAEAHRTAIRINEKSSSGLIRAENLAKYWFVNVGELSFYVAETQAQRKEGLLGLTELDKHGMVFICDESNFSPFTMSGMYFDLRIVFIASDGSVVSDKVYSKDHVGPIVPGGNYKFVLELPTDIELDVNETAKRIAEELARHHYKDKDKKKRDKEKK